MRKLTICAFLHSNSSNNNNHEIREARERESKKNLSTSTKTIHTTDARSIWKNNEHKRAIPQQQQRHKYLLRCEIKIIFTLMYDRSRKKFPFHKESISKLGKKNPPRLIKMSTRLVLVLCASEYADKRRLNKQRRDLFETGPAPAHKLWLSQHHTAVTIQFCSLFRFFQFFFLFPLRIETLCSSLTSTIY